MKYSFLSGLLFCTLISFSQAPSIQWQKCIGGVAHEYSGEIKPTTDGGYIVCGSTKSNDSDAATNNGWNTYDVLVVKLNSSGNIEWTNCFGGTNDDIANDIIETSDGGFLVVGYSISNNGDVIGNNGSYDVLVLKISSNGNLIWSDSYGGSGADFGNKIGQLQDGNYLIVGYTESNDFDVSGNHGGNNTSDGWVFKINVNGQLIWQKCFGGSAGDAFWSFQQLSNGEILYTGETYSVNGDVTLNHGGGDVWVVKTGLNGLIQWQKCYGGSSQDRSWDLYSTSDGSIICIGQTKSNDFDVSGNHGGNIPIDSWVIKLSSSGNIIWQKCLGGTSSDYGKGIIESSDGSYWVLCYTGSSNGDILNLQGNTDVWLLKLSTSGNILSNTTFGGSSYDSANSINLTNNGGMVICGATASNNGDVSGNHGGAAVGDADIWVFKTCYGTPSYSIDYQSSCNSFTWINGQTYYTSNNTDTYTLPAGTINGCDSIIQLNLTIEGNDTTYIDTLVNSSSFNFNGQIYYQSGIYYDTLVNSSGCVTIVVLDLTIQISNTIEINSNNATIFPNPVRDILYITLPQFSNCLDFKIEDEFGKLIFKGNLDAQENEINLESLSKGIYFLKVNGFENVERLIKN